MLIATHDLIGLGFLIGLQWFCYFLISICCRLLECVFAHLAFVDVVYLEFWQIRFIDNTDPAGIDHQIAQLGPELASTLVIVISKVHKQNSRGYNFDLIMLLLPHCCTEHVVDSNL